MIALPSFDRYSILFHYEIDANEQGEGAKPMACFALFAGERAIDPPLFARPARSREQAIDPPVLLPSTVLRTKNRVRWQVLTV
ncbi:hypothetical protein [Paraeggerthella sp.]|uniref:hypothetical protein n=1 Tax=Paraeggerthella sp. TaxID=2897350 RepID=UPI003AB553FC